jgi:hypothetical protein
MRRVSECAMTFGRSLTRSIAVLEINYWILLRAWLVMAHLGHVPDTGII